jgi:hypothetical protein
MPSLGCFSCMMGVGRKRRQGGTAAEGGGRWKREGDGLYARIRKIGC